MGAEEAAVFERKFSLSRKEILSADVFLEN